MMQKFVNELISEVKENVINHKESVIFFMERGIEFISIDRVLDIINELNEKYNQPIPEQWKQQIENKFNEVV